MKKTLSIFIVILAIIGVLALSSCSSAENPYALPTSINAPTQTQVAVVATQSALELESAQAKAQAQVIDAQRTSIASDLKQEQAQMTQAVLKVTQTIEAQKVYATEDAIARIVQATQVASAKETERSWAIVVANMTQEANNLYGTQVVNGNIATATAQWRATEDALYIAQQEKINEAMIAQADAEKRSIELAVERQQAVNEIMAYMPIIILGLFLLITVIVLFFMLSNDTKLIKDPDGNLTAIVQKRGNTISVIQPGRAVNPVVIVEKNFVTSPQLSDNVSQLSTTRIDQMLQTIRSAGNADNALPSGAYRNIIDETAKHTPLLPGETNQNPMLAGQGIKLIEANQIRAWLTDVNDQLTGEIIDAEYPDENED